MRHSCRAQKPVIRGKKSINLGRMAIVGVRATRSLGHAGHKDRLILMGWLICLNSGQLRHLRVSVVSRVMLFRLSSFSENGYKRAAEVHRLVRFRPQVVDSSYPPIGDYVATRPHGNTPQWGSDWKSWEVRHD